MTSWLNSSARSHCTQWPVWRRHQQVGVGHQVRAASVPPDGRLTLSSRPQSTSVGVAKVLSLRSRVRSIRHSVRIARRPSQRRVGDDLGVDRGRIPDSIRSPAPIAVVDKIRPDERRQLVAARPVAAVVRQQAFQAGSGESARRADAAGPHQHQLADPVRGVQREPQRRGSAVGVADQVRAVDAEFVEQPADRVGEVAERIVAVDAFGGAAVARHVGHDDPEVLGQGIDVARVIGHPRCAGSSAVQHHHGRTGAGLGEEDRLAVDASRCVRSWCSGHAGLQLSVWTLNPAGGAGSGWPIRLRRRRIRRAARRRRRAFFAAANGSAAVGSLTMDQRRTLQLFRPRRRSAGPGLAASVCSTAQRPPRTSSRRTVVALLVDDPRLWDLPADGAVAASAKKTVDGTARRGSTMLLQPRGATPGTLRQRAEDVVANRRDDHGCARMISLPVKHRAAGHLRDVRLAFGLVGVEHRLGQPARRARRRASSTGSPRRARRRTCPGRSTAASRARRRRPGRPARPASGRRPGRGGCRCDARGSSRSPRVIPCPPRPSRSRPRISRSLLVLVVAHRELPAVMTQRSGAVDGGPFRVAVEPEPVMAGPILEHFGVDDDPALAVRAARVTDAQLPAGRR